MIIHPLIWLFNRLYEIMNNEYPHPNDNDWIKVKRALYAIYQIVGVLLTLWFLIWLMSGVSGGVVSYLNDITKGGMFPWKQY